MIGRAAPRPPLLQLLQPLPETTAGDISETDTMLNSVPCSGRSRTPRKRNIVWSNPLEIGPGPAARGEVRQQLGQQQQQGQQQQRCTRSRGLTSGSGE